MNRFKNVMMWAVIILIVLMSILNILLTFYLNSEHSKKIEKRFEEAINIINIPKQINGIDGHDGITPVKGIDYFDGKNGKDSISTHTKETLIKEVPVNGKDGINAPIPIIQCNVEKNRWEFKYIGDSHWRILNGTATKCTVTKDDILELLK